MKMQKKSLVVMLLKLLMKCLLCPAYDITYANGMYTKNDLLDIAKEIIEQTIDMFSTFRSRVKELEINEESIGKIEKNLKMSFYQ